MLLRHRPNQAGVPDEVQAQAEPPAEPDDTVQHLQTGTNNHFRKLGVIYLSLYIQFSFLIK